MAFKEYIVNNLAVNDSYFKEYMSPCFERIGLYAIFAQSKCSAESQTTRSITRGVTRTVGSHRGENC